MNHLLFFSLKDKYQELECKDEVDIVMFKKIIDPFGLRGREEK